MDKVENIEFYTNGINDRIIWDNQKKTICEITPKDDINAWWLDDNEADLDKIESTEENWRKLDKNKADDLIFIRNIIGVLNYFSQHENEDTALIENVKQLIEDSRSIWQKYENEVIPTPIPHPDVKISNMPY